MRLKYYSGAQVTGIIEKLAAKEYLEMLNAFAKEPSADVVERKDLDTITEAHEQIGYEKGYRDGYAQAKVEVVRCKECKFYDFWERKGIHLCVRWSGDPYEAAEPGEDDFCSYGERRDDDAET